MRRCGWGAWRLWAPVSWGRERLLLRQACLEQTRRRFRDALGNERDIAQNQATSSPDEQAPEYEEIAEARRCYCLNAGEVNYYVAFGVFADNLIDGSKLVGNLELFGGQINDYEIFRGMLNSHFYPFCFERANSYIFNSGIGIRAGLIEQKNRVYRHKFRGQEVIAFVVL